MDAVGDRRNDLASALDYTSENLKWTATVQRVAVTTPALVDDVTTAALSFSDLKHIQGYLKYGNDSNALALGKGGGQRYDAGATWNSKTFAVYGNLRKVTDGYGPADAYVAKPDIAGYGLYANKIWLFSGASWLQSVSLGGYFDRYHGRLYGLDQADNQLVFDALTKGAFDFNISSGSSYLRGSDRTFVPVSQNGAALTYHSGSAQQSGNFGNHGPSATPTTISYATGRYGNGRLDTWVRSTTMRASERGTLTLELDNTAQWFSHGADNVQWFERASFAYQITRDSSLALGVRRAVGSPPIPNGGGNCVGSCSNIAVSYHLRRQRSELYVGYGDPNALTTTPQALLKYIFYVGAGARSNLRGNSRIAIPGNEKTAV